MSFQVQYFYQFRDLNDQLYRVEILKNSETAITPEEIEGSTKPFSVEYPSVDKFEPIHGSGCELNVISSTNMKFLSLYTADMMEYQIHFYKVIDGIDYLIWAGYKDSELYREDFSQISDYPVQFTGNDGFNLLERLNFVDENGVKYSGIVTQWDILKIIFTRLNLPIQKLYVCISTVLDDSPAGATETIFHKQYSVSENFYDEDGKPSSLRDILESFLKPLGAFIRQDSGNYFICDVNSWGKNSDLTYKVFSLSDFSYIHDETVDMTIGDLSQIGFDSDRQSFEFVPGYNKQVVSWSPYKQIKIFEEDLNLDGLTFDHTIDNGSDSTEYKWQEKVYKDTKQYQWTNNTHGEDAFVCSIIGTGTENDEEKDTYIKIPNTVQLDSWNLPNVNQYHVPLYKIKVKLPYLLGSDTNKYFLKVEAKGFVRTKTYLNKPDEKSEDHITHLYVPIMIYLNDNHFYEQPEPFYGYPEWGTWILEGESQYYNDGVQINTGEAIGYSHLAFYNKDQVTTIADTWVSTRGTIPMYKPMKHNPDNELIPLPASIQGELEVRIVSTARVNDSLEYYVKDIRIKDLKLTICDSLGNEVKTDDIEYEGVMDPLYSKEAEKIELIQGTNVNDDPTALGAILYKSNDKYYFCKNWTREGVQSIIEKLLIRSVKSNDKDASIKLNADLPILNTGLGTITCNNYLPGKVFAITSLSQDFENASSSVQLTEIHYDSVNIE